MSLTGYEIAAALKELLALRGMQDFSLSSEISPVVVVDDARWPPYRTTRRRWAGWLQVNAVGTGFVGRAGILNPSAHARAYVVIDRVKVNQLSAGINSYELGLAYGVADGVLNETGRCFDTDSRAVSPSAIVGPVAFHHAHNTSSTLNVGLERILHPGAAYSGVEFSSSLPVVLRPGDALMVSCGQADQLYDVCLGGWFDE